MGDIKLGCFRGKESQVRIALNKLRSPMSHHFVLSDLWAARNQTQYGDDLHFLMGMLLAVPEEFQEDLVKLLHEGQKTLNHVRG